MGHMRHHGMIVTGFNKKSVQSLRAKAVELLGGLVSGVRKSPHGRYYSFAVFPDGSLEGDPDSNEGDKNREQFKQWLQAESAHRPPFHWVEVQYADDDGETRIVADSDAKKRR